MSSETFINAFLEELEKLAQPTFGPGTGGGVMGGGIKPIGAPGIKPAPRNTPRVSIPKLPGMSSGTTPRLPGGTAPAFPKSPLMKASVIATRVTGPNPRIVGGK